MKLFVIFFFAGLLNLSEGVTDVMASDKEWERFKECPPTLRVVTLQPWEVEEENDINSFIKEKFSNRENTMKEKIQEIIEIDNSNLIVTKPIMLAVGGITIINCDQQISKVIVGNKDVIEVEKATGNRKRIYIIGKEVCQSCNVLVEVKGEVINLFFRIIKGAYLGRFNSEVIIKKTNKISQ